MQERERRYATREEQPGFCANYEMSSHTSISMQTAVLYCTHYTTNTMYILRFRKRPFSYFTIWTIKRSRHSRPTHHRCSPHIPSTIHSIHKRTWLAFTVGNIAVSTPFYFHSPLASNVTTYCVFQFSLVRWFPRQHETSSQPLLYYYFGFTYNRQNTSYHNPFTHGLPNSIPFTRRPSSTAHTIAHICLVWCTHKRIHSYTHARLISLC